jgi:hypothetical protein
MLGQPMSPMAMPLASPPLCFQSVAQSEWLFPFGLLPGDWHARTQCQGRRVALQSFPTYFEAAIAYSKSAWLVPIVN